MSACNPKPSKKTYYLDIDNNLPPPITQNKYGSKTKRIHLFPIFAEKKENPTKKKKKERKEGRQTALPSDDLG